MRTTPPNGTPADNVSSPAPAGNASVPNIGLVDAEAAAEFLGVPSSWVRAEARAERIPHRRLGRYRRFSLPELAAWADEQAKGPAIYRKHTPGMGSG